MDRETTIIDHVSSHHGRETAMALHEFFNGLALPVPLVSEVTLTTDRGYILFLNEASILIRLTPDFWWPRVDHEHVLQPFGSAILGKLRADPQPGIVSPISPEDVARLSYTINNEGYIFWDTQAVNCGYIPGLPPEDRHVVILDNGAIKKCGTGFRRLCMMFEGAKAAVTTIQDKARRQIGLPVPVRQMLTPLRSRPGFQAQYYAELRESFGMLRSGNERIPRDRDVARFWNACRTATQEGRMVAGWVDHFARQPGEDSSYKNIVHGSTAYAQRWVMPT